MTDKEKIMECLPIVLRPEIQELVAEEIMAKFPDFFIIEGASKLYSKEVVIERLKADYLKQTRGQYFIDCRSYLFTVLMLKFKMTDTEVSLAINGLKDRTSIRHGVQSIARMRWFAPVFTSNVAHLQRLFPMEHPFLTDELRVGKRTLLPPFQVPKEIFIKVKRDTEKTGDSVGAVLNEILANYYRL